MKTTFSSLLLALLATQWLPAQETTPTLEQVLEAHVRWRGGRQAVAALSDVVTIGRIDGGAIQNAAMTATRTRQGRLRVEFDANGLETTTVIGPDGAFLTNASGQVEPLPSADVSEARFAAMLLFADLPPSTPAASWRLLGSEEKDGRTWAVARFEPADEPPRDLFVDPSDGSLTWIRTTHGKGTRWDRLDDWRLVGDVRLWFRQEAVEAGQGRSLAVWSEIRVNTGPPAERFAKPKARRRVARFADGMTSTGWLPIELYLDRYIYLRGKLNGTETDVVLDSGAGATVVDAALADQVGLVAKGEVTARGVGGQQKASFLGGLRLELGPLVFTGVTAVRIDLSGVAKMAGRGMPVILGKEAFQELVIDIDYPNARLAFHEPSAFRYEGTGKTARLFAGQDGHRTVECTIDGRATGRFTVDTGSGDTVAVFAAFHAKHGLLEGRSPVSEWLQGGVGGRIVTKVATLQSFDFAGYELLAMPASFTTDAKGGAFDTTRAAGNLGAEVFRRFRLVFDYGRDALHVEPGPDWNSQDWPKERFGLATMPRDGKLVVVFVAPGSPAAKDGWSEGDVIDRIDGQPATAELWRREIRGARGKPRRTELVLTDGNGQERKLVAAAYY